MSNFRVKPCVMWDVRKMGYTGSDLCNTQPGARLPLLARSPMLQVWDYFSHSHVFFPARCLKVTSLLSFIERFWGDFHLKSNHPSLIQVKICIVSRLTGGKRMLPSSSMQQRLTSLHCACSLWRAATGIWEKDIFLRKAQVDGLLQAQTFWKKISSWRAWKLGGEDKGRQGSEASGYEGWLDED